MPNKEFPATGDTKRGMYSVAIVSGNISLVDVPDEKQTLCLHTGCHAKQRPARS